MTEQSVLGSRVTTDEELTALLGLPAERVIRKERPELHPRQQQWIAASPLCMIATSGADGSCDVSPRGDAAGMFLSPDSRTVVLPERPGNRRADSLRNILANPQVGLVFMIPGRTQTLRVNGRAELTTDGDYFDALVYRGHRPKLCIVVGVEQVFFHCGKAFMRSGAWEPERWQPDVLPSHARLVKEVEALPQSLEELEHYYGPSYAAGLYAERPVT